MVKYPCGTCAKSATKDAIECNFCGLWHHAKPECMLEFTKDQIAMLKELCKDRTCWTCNKCGIIMKKLNGRMADLEKNVTAVQKDVKTVQAKQVETDKAVKDITSEVKELKGKMENNCGNVKASVMAEVGNRELRKFNLIIYGLAEQPTDGAESRESQMDKDKKVLDALLTQMSQDSEMVNDTIKYRRRLGKKEVGKVRPLLLSFTSVDCRNCLLESASDIKGPLAKKVRIRPDLTQMQREDDSKVITEITDLNKDEPKDELGDYRWRVVGPPGMLQKAKTRDLNKWKQAEERRRANRVLPNPHQVVEPVVQEEQEAEENGEEEEAAD